MKIKEIIIVYSYHCLFIILSFMLMESYHDSLLTITFIADLLFLIYLIVSRIKSYMPWIVYLHLAIGTAVQVVLNLFGIVPKDGGWFSGLSQLFYIVLLLIFTCLYGIINLKLWLINREKE